jgi:hypothetical protein
VKKSKKFERHIKNDRKWAERDALELKNGHIKKRSFDPPNTRNNSKHEAREFNERNERKTQDGRERENQISRTAR